MAALSQQIVSATTSNGTPSSNDAAMHQSDTSQPAGLQVGIDSSNNTNVDIDNQQQQQQQQCPTSSHNASSLTAAHFSPNTSQNTNVQPQSVSNLIQSLRHQAHTAASSIKDQAASLITQHTRIGNSRQCALENIDSQYEVIQLGVATLADLACSNDSFIDAATQLGTGTRDELITLHKSIQDMLDILGGDQHNMVTSLSTLKGKHDTLLGETIALSSVLGISECADIRGNVRSILTERDELYDQVATLSQEITHLNHVIHSFQQEPTGNTETNVSRQHSSSTGPASQSQGQNTTSHDTLLQQILCRASARGTNTSQPTQNFTHCPSTNNDTVLQSQAARLNERSQTSTTARNHANQRSQGLSTYTSNTPNMLSCDPSDLTSPTSDMKLHMWKAQSVQNLEKFSGSSDTMSLDKYVKLFLLRHPRQLWADDELCTIFSEKLTGVARQHLLGIPKSCYNSFDMLICELDKRINGEKRLNKVHKLTELQRLQHDTTKPLTTLIIEFEKLSTIAYNDMESSQRSFIMAQQIFSVLSKANWHGLDSLLMILEDELTDKYDRLKSQALLQERVRDNRKALSEGRSQPGKPTNNNKTNNSGIKQCSFCKRLGHIEQECRTKAHQQGYKLNGKPDVSTLQCHFCKRFGHIEKECRTKAYQMNNNGSQPRQGNNNQPPRWTTSQPQQTRYDSSSRFNNNANNSQSNFRPNNFNNRTNPSTQTNSGGANNRVMQLTDSDNTPLPELFSARVTGWSTLQSIRADVPSPTAGARVTQPIDIFGTQTEALIDTGAQISTISSSFIIKLMEAGQNVEEMVEELPLNQACKVFDASGNPMCFTMLLRTPIRVYPDGTTVNTVFHVVNGNTDEDVLLGTNILPSVGIFLSRMSSSGFISSFTQSVNPSVVTTSIHKPFMPSLSPAVITSPMTQVHDQTTPSVATPSRSPPEDHLENTSEPGLVCKSVFVRKRLVIPPMCTKVLNISTAVNKELTGVLWSDDESKVTSGVISFASDGSAEIAIHNHSSSTIRFLKQQIVGHTDIEDFRWKSISREEVVELLDHNPDRVQLTQQQRTSILLNIIQGQNNIPIPLQQLVSEFADVFAIDDFELKQTHLIPHTINTGDAAPVRQKARPMPMGAKGKFKDILDSLLDKGIVESSKSPWSSPIVLVTKRDGTLRLCVDYRELNKRIKLDSYPLLRMDDMLQSLSGKSVFSTLDLSAGFWQVPLKKTSKEKTAFATTEGLFQFNVLPFGLATSPATFQRLMATVLSDLIGETNEVQVYIDDFLIATDTVDRHIMVLRKVFNALRSANLCLKPQKCSLMTSQVTYLGHRIDAFGVHPDPDKIKAVQDFPRPTCITEIRSFLGLCGYYRKFVHRFGAISKPLNELTSSSTPWEWSDTREKAFKMLKEVLCSAPVLAQPDFNGAQSGEKPFLLYTDACKSGVGAVLCQEGKDKFLHPIHFVSKSLNTAESKYTISDLEGLAVVHAVQRLRSYLYDMHVLVRTDHQPLVSFFKSNTYGRVVRWALALQSYNKLRIEYVQGKSNVVADALSRGTLIRDQDDESPTCEGQPECALLTLQSTSGASNPTSWLELLRRDNDFHTIIDNIESNKSPESTKIARMNDKVNTSQFSIAENHLWFNTSNGDILKVVPIDLRKTLFNEVHAGILAGHFGPNKIIKSLKRNYFWPGLSSDIRQWHSECTQCFLTNNHDVNTPPLKPILRGKPYELVSVDLMELGLTSSGNRYVLVIVDNFSKFLGAYPIPNKSAEIVAETLMSRWICEGARWPKEILSDKGTEFLNQITESICKTTGISWITTKGYNPRENGLVERANATIKNALKKKVESPAEWDKILPFVVYAYNTSIHDSTGESPFFLLHAFDPPSVSALDSPQMTLWLADNVDYRTALVEGMQSAHTIARDKLQQETTKMKQYYDINNSVQKSWFPSIGDRVFLKNSSATRSAHPKLLTDFSGPYRVLDCSENSALIVDIKGTKEPIRVPFDKLIKTPDTITDDPVGITYRKRGRPPKINCNLINLHHFSAPQHLNLVGSDHALHPEHVCKGGPVVSALCSTHIGQCSMATAPLSDFLDNLAPGAESFRPASVLRLAQATAALQTYGISIKATDETVAPTASLVTTLHLTNAIIEAAKRCAHVRSQLKQYGNTTPLLFGLQKWKIDDEAVRYSLLQAKTCAEKADAPPSKTLLVVSEAICAWAGLIEGDGITLVKDVSAMPAKVFELLAQLHTASVNLVILLDGPVPPSFTVMDFLPTEKRAIPFKLFFATAPHGLGNCDEWHAQLVDLASAASAINGQASSIVILDQPFCAYNVLGRSPGPPHRMLPEHRVLEFFDTLMADCGFTATPTIAFKKELPKRKWDEGRRPNDRTRKRTFHEEARSSRRSHTNDTR